jgi:ribonuclease HI
LEHSTLNFLKEPLFPRKPPKETKINLNLLQPCSKKEDPQTLRQKGLETIEKFSQGNLAIVYTDGSSDKSLNKGGAGILFLLPNGDKFMHKINTGLIASNFTSELLAIKEALSFYMTNQEISVLTEGLAIFSDSKAALEAIKNGETNVTSAINVLLEELHGNGKSCLLQWIPAHVNIEGNECADSLAKEGRNADQPCTTITLADANAVAKHRLLPHSFKKPLITDFDCPRILTSTITRLRTNHYKGMKILPDKTRTYIPCKNCTDAQLNPDHILECPALTPHILQLGMVPLASELREVLYSTDVLELAVAVLKTHEAI